jgi:hypothetical protein
MKYSHIRRRPKKMPIQFPRQQNYVAIWEKLFLYSYFSEQVHFLLILNTRKQHQMFLISGNFSHCPVNYATENDA